MGEKTVIELKSEIFDIVRQQEALQIQFNQFEGVKQNKLKELLELEKKEV